MTMLLNISKRVCISQDEHTWILKLLYQNAIYRKMILKGLDFEKIFAKESFEECKN